ncbi:MAG: hypothetical protein ABFS39_14000 [Pseudomonadota bacterium]
MSFETYDVYFSGKLMKDQDLQAVQNKIGAMFKLEGLKLQRLFSGQPVAIKKGIDMEQAVEYRVAFRDAGALVDIRPTGTPQQQPPTPAKPGKESGPQTPLTLSPPNSFDLSDCSAPVTPRPIPDISSLELAKPGIILDEIPSPAPLEIDTEDLELDKPGVILGPSIPQPSVEIDIGDLQLKPANPGNLEEFQPQVDKLPLPNIDHLGFAEQDEKPTGKAAFKISED